MVEAIERTKEWQRMKERQRVTDHLDKLSDICRTLRVKPGSVPVTGAEVEDALFNILLALRLMQGEDNE